MYRDDDGGVQHGELHLGDAWVMIGSEPEGGDERFCARAGAGFIYLAVPDAAAVCERASRAPS